MRLERTRILHTPLEDSDNFMYGFNANYLRSVVDYWRTKFDWRKQEKIINNFPQFITEIEGLKVSSRINSFLRSKVFEYVDDHIWRIMYLHFYILISFI